MITNNNDNDNDSNTAIEGNDDNNRTTSLTSKGMKLKIEIKD